MGRLTVGLERALGCVWGGARSLEVTGRRAGRRYTLTEGDFHHLKNARLTHLHLPPLKIVTIHECDSGEASATATPHPTVAPKASLAIFQVSQVSAGPELRGGTLPHPTHPHPAGTTLPTHTLPQLCPSPQRGKWGLARSSGWGSSTPPHPPVLFDLSLLPPPPWLCPTAPGEGPHRPLRGP